MPHTLPTQISTLPSLLTFPFTKRRSLSEQGAVIKDEIIFIEHQLTHNTDLSFKYNFYA